MLFLFLFQAPDYQEAQCGGKLGVPRWPIRLSIIAIMVCLVGHKSVPRFSESLFRVFLEI